MTITTIITIVVTCPVYKVYLGVLVMIAAHFLWFFSVFCGHYVTMVS
jgi:hypothetical protein